MSVQRYETGDGTRWRVRWRDESGVMHSRTFASKRDASGLDAEIKGRKFRGTPVPRPGRWTLAAAWDKWLSTVGKNRAPSTLVSYRGHWDRHVRNQFDHHRLEVLAARPVLIEEFIAALEERGVGPASRRKVLMVMSAVFTACVRWQEVASNPVLVVEKPSAKPARLPRPFPPIVVERIRKEILSLPSRDGTGLRREEDAVLVSVMSYAGLRPQEALALTFDDVSGGTLLIDKAVRTGRGAGGAELVEAGPTKTGKNRHVPLIAPLEEDLLSLRDQRSKATGTDLIFPSRRNTPYWSLWEYGSWRKKVWKKAVGNLAEADQELAHVAQARPYDCRGSYVSLRLRAGQSPVEVAEDAGHSLQVMFNHYSHVIEELRGQQIVPAEEQVRRARKLVEEKTDDQVAALAAESLKPPEQVRSSAYGLLYGKRRTLSSRRKPD